jgi:hypothetical protein
MFLSVFFFFLLEETKKREAKKSDTPTAHEATAVVGENNALCACSEGCHKQR